MAIPLYSETPIGWLWDGIPRPPCQCLRINVYVVAAGPVPEVVPRWPDPRRPSLPCYETLVGGRMPGMTAAGVRILQHGEPHPQPLSLRGEGSSGRLAMLTGMVNIAVFAAFRWCDDDVLLPNAAFKPVCAIWQRDIWRSGWQKRQETARFAANTARVRGMMGASMLSGARLHAGASGRFATVCGCSRCWRRGVAPKLWN